MQAAIGPNDVSSAANPLLDIWIQIPQVVDDGTGSVVSVLSAPASLSFSIFDISTEAKLQSPVLAFGPHLVDLIVDQVLDVAGPGTGHYAAATSPTGWTVPPTGSGRYQIVWTYTLAPGGPTYRMTRDFDVLQGGAPPQFALGAYATVSDMRDEGVTTEDSSDVRLLRTLQMASRFIERITGRFYEPRYFVQTIDGTGGRAVQLGDPLIALVTVTLGNPVVNTIGLGSIRVYNRWLTERLTNPDDRDDPKIEFVHFRDIFGRQRSASVDSPLFGVPFRDLFFPSGVQNVNVTGLWGYTEWDGSASGATPMLIRHATKLIAMREYRKLADEARDDRKRHRLTQERTRDQSYVLDSLSEGAFTGDREIDDILLSFMRPIRIGSP